MVAKVVPLRLPKPCCAKLHALPQRVSMRCRDLRTRSARRRAYLCYACARRSCGARCRSAPCLTAQLTAPAKTHAPGHAQAMETRARAHARLQLVTLLIRSAEVPAS